jgi:hypothetical protein
MTPLDRGLLEEMLSEPGMLTEPEVE